MSSGPQLASIYHHTSRERRFAPGHPDPSQRRLSTEQERHRFRELPGCTVRLSPIAPLPIPTTRVPRPRSMTRVDELLGEDRESKMLTITATKAPTNTPKTPAKRPLPPPTSSKPSRTRSFLSSKSPWRPSLQVRLCMPFVMLSSCEGPGTRLYLRSRHQC